MSGVRRGKRRREQPEARDRRRFRQWWGCEPMPYYRTVDEVFAEWAGDVKTALMLIQEQL